MTPDCAKDGTEPCNGYLIIRAHLDVERQVQAKLILERDKWFNESQRLRKALEPFAALADREQYTLDDVPHGLFIDAKLAVRGLRVVNGAVEQTAPVSRED